MFLSEPKKTHSLLIIRGVEDLATIKMMITEKISFYHFACPDDEKRRKFKEILLKNIVAKSRSPGRCVTNLGNFDKVFS